METDFRPNARLIDFRVYRPASVLVVDLVKHSSRGKSTVQLVQSIMEEVFQRAKETLRIDDAHFNYTGDGYVCAFVGDSSARALDFINTTMPELTRRFAQHDQQLRVGIDFGFIHLSKNVLTGASEHFDLPAIQAARLENAAMPGQILCTENVQRMFAPHYPQMFSSEPKTILTKDREITAFEILPFDTANIQRLFSDFLFRRLEARNETEARQKILLVDDESDFLESLSEWFNLTWKGYEIISATSAEDALVVFTPGEFAFVLTDWLMPGLNGHELLEHLLVIDPEVTVVMLTAFGYGDCAEKFLSAGGYYLLTKPFELRELTEVLNTALLLPSHHALRSALQILCEDLGGFLWLMQQVSEDLHSILRQVGSGDRVANSLLRHKAKQIVMDFVASIQPGTDVLKALSSVKVQLACVARLSRVVGRVSISDLRSYLNLFLADLRKLNPNVEFVLVYPTSEGSPSSIPMSAEVILVVCELVDNAISAIERSGTIEVIVHVLEISGLLQIVVRDTGPGIPNELKEYIFDAGTSTKGAGRGLGLCLVKEAVRLLRGEISYEYTGGASFSIVLPFT